MCLPCCWTMHSSRRHHWPMAWSVTCCDSLPLFSDISQSSVATTWGVVGSVVIALLQICKLRRAKICSYLGPPFCAYSGLFFYSGILVVVKDMVGTHIIYRVCQIKCYTIERNLYFSNDSIDLSQTFILCMGVFTQQILQILLKNLIWFNWYCSLNFKVHFFKWTCSCCTLNIHE